MKTYPTMTQAEYRRAYELRDPVHVDVRAMDEIECERNLPVIMAAGERAAAGRSFDGATLITDHDDGPIIVFTWARPALLN